MTIPWDLVARIGIPILTTVIGALILQRIEQRPRLISYLSHISDFALGTPQPPVGSVEAAHPSAAAPASNAQPLQTVGPQQPPHVYAHSIVIRNVGKKTAFNVRIGHNAVPASYQIAPSVKHEVIAIPNGGWEILVPTLVPGEQIQVSYLYFPPMTWAQINSYTKSDETMARVLNVLPTPQPSPLAKFIAYSLLALGFATFVYLLISVIEWAYVITNTPR